MNSKKILFISQEIYPYVAASPLSMEGRDFPQYMLEKGWEARTFLPKWGNINERRNQLHEVIRLSGMNIIINEADYPLIIKVASLMPSHMQVYFIDNEEYFFKRAMARDENGKEYADNAERAIFYARGVLETVKKLRWCPEVIVCQGWISAVAPLYIRSSYADEPPFHNVRIVFAPSSEKLEMPLPDDFARALVHRATTSKLVAAQGLEFKTFDDLIKLGINFSDALAEATEGVDPAYAKYAESRGLPVLPFGGEGQYETFADFVEKMRPEQTDD